MQSKMLNELTYTLNKLMPPRVKFLMKTMSVNGRLLTFTQTRHFPSAPSRGLARSAEFFPKATSSVFVWTGGWDGVVVGWRWLPTTASLKGTIRGILRGVSSLPHLGPRWFEEKNLLLLRQTSDITDFNSENGKGLGRDFLIRNKAILIKLSTCLAAPRGDRRVRIHFYITRTNKRWTN